MAQTPGQRLGDARFDRGAGSVRGELGRYQPPSAATLHPLDRCRVRVESSDRSPKIRVQNRTCERTQGSTADLEPVAPHNAVPGSWRPARGRSALVRLTDGTWTSLAINSWGRDKRGRWCVELSWPEGGAPESAWFVSGRIKPTVSF